MSALPIERAQPDEQDATTAGAALSHMREYFARHPDEPRVVRLVVADDGDEVVVPRSAVRLLAGILAHMAAGHTVSVVPSQTELTTQQAADLLNVSRPYVIGLLEAGKIEYRMVGAHRRVNADSLIDYLRRDDAPRAAAAELTALNQEMGLI